MRLRTQFAILTAAVTLFPLLFSLLYFSGQSMPRDPRIPTRKFIKNVAGIMKEQGRLSIDDIKRAGEASGLPVLDAALIAPDGVVLLSSFRDLPVGTAMQFVDFVKPPLMMPGKPRPELRLLPIDETMDRSPLLLFDVQPFWTKQDVRYRSFVLVASFTLGIFIIAGVISLLIVRSTGRAIRKLEEDTAIVAVGRLDHEVMGTGSVEMRSLAARINHMRIALRDMITRRMNMLIGVSHDLKTPIALIQGYADALADNLDADEETRLRYIRIIRDKAGQLEDLVSDLIEFMKIGEHSDAMEETDIGTFMLALGRRFDEDARLLGKRFVCTIAPELEHPDAQSARMVVMNRLLAERAIENLISNSFRYTGPDGVIELACAREEGGLVISVTDNGPGVPPSDLPFIFDAFYRGSHSRQESGHGLGLTIVKAIADLHGWKVEARSRPDGASGLQVRLLLG